jgi:hypothetical protein
MGGRLAGRVDHRPDDHRIERNKKRTVEQVRGRARMQEQQSGLRDDLRKKPLDR